MNLYEETKYIIDKYNVYPNKKLGQNFLINEQSLNKIAEDVNSDDTVIEIGPGLGTLTKVLLEKAKKVYAVELDPKMCEILKSRFIAYNNLEIINKDILKIDINKDFPNAKVVANLPYYITTSIITELLKTNIKDITILIQKEVAERICEEPGKSKAGAITYYVKYYADSKIIGNVGKEEFIPSPKVESGIVKITKLEKPRVEVNDEKLFFDLIKTNFTKRRKTILNSLSSIVEKEKLQQILNELNIKDNIRGEQLTLEEYAKLANKIDNIKIA